MAPANKKDKIQGLIAETMGVVVSRQVMTFQDQELPSGESAKAMGIREGSILKVEYFKIPITVKTFEDQTLSLMVEPIDTIGTLKQMIQDEMGLEIEKQLLQYQEKELDQKEKTIKDCGIQANAILTLDTHDDPAIFVDIKATILFPVDRPVVVEERMLTLKNVDSLHVEFQESVCKGLKSY